MHDLSTISVIQKIEQIPERDRIVLATVENYKVIIKKDEFQVGDKCIYIYYDAALPIKPEYEFLRKNSYSKKYNVFRIKAMKMAGVISEGLVLPLSILPEDKRDLKVGTVLDDILEIKNYEELSSNEVFCNTQASSKKKTLFHHLMKYRWFRKIFGNRYERNRKLLFEYPCPKSDEENIEKIWDGIKNSTETFYLTAKAEGSAATYILRKKKLLCFSHNFYNDSGCWGKVAKIYDMKNALKKVNKFFKTEIAIQGEICGPGIQRNIYKFNDFKFFLYGAYDTKTGRRLNIGELDKIAELGGFQQVASLGTSNLLGSVDDMLENAVRPSVYNPELKYEEGVVWRNYTGSIHFKCKSRPYKLWWNRED